VFNMGRRASHYITLPIPHEPLYSIGLTLGRPSERAMQFATLRSQDPPMRELELSSRLPRGVLCVGGTIATQMRI